MPWARLAPGAAALGEGARPEGMEGSGESSSRDSVRAEQQRFPPSAERGSAVVVAAAAAQESGHHGCLYYPPSNSNFFPSLLTNYPASVLISFYYWN